MVSLLLLDPFQICCILIVESVGLKTPPQVHTDMDLSVGRKCLLLHMYCLFFVLTSGVDSTCDGTTFIICTITMGCAVAFFQKFTDTHAIITYPFKTSTIPTLLLQGVLYTILPKLAITCLISSIGIQYVHTSLHRSCHFLLRM